MIAPGTHTRACPTWLRNAVDHVFLAVETYFANITDFWGPYKVFLFLLSALDISNTIQFKVTIRLGVEVCERDLSSAPEQLDHQIRLC